MYETRYQKFLILIQAKCGLLPTKIQMRQMTMNKFSIIDGLKVLEQRRHFLSFFFAAPLTRTTLHDFL